MTGTTILSFSGRAIGQTKLLAAVEATESVVVRYIKDLMTPPANGGSEPRSSHNLKRLIGFSRMLIKALKT